MKNIHVVSNGLVEYSRFNYIEFGKVKIKHNTLSA